MREEAFRRKITWFTFWFSLLVVWTHSFNAELFLGKTAAGEAVYRIERLFGDLAAQIAVPGFFLVSGYLFYRNFTWEKLGNKWRSRIRSVLIPYLLWNALYYLGYVAASRLPGVSGIVGKGAIPFSLPALGDAVVNHTYLYVFWYLRQLLFLIALAPALYGVLKRTWSAGVYLAALLAVLWLDVRLPLVNGDALFYYSAAAWFGIRREQGGGPGFVEEAWSKKRRLLGTGLMALALVSLGIYRVLWLPFFAVMYRFAMVAGLWLFVREDRLKSIRPWMEYNFFLYAVHFALVRLVNKGAAAGFHRFFPAGEGAAALIPLALFLAMPFLMAAVSYQAGRLMRRFCPRLFGVLNGGR